MYTTSLCNDFGMSPFDSRCLRFCFDIGLLLQYSKHALASCFFPAYSRPASESDWTPRTTLAWSYHRNTVRSYSAGGGLEEGSLERTISTELPLHRFALGLGLTSASCQTDNTAQSEVGTSTTLIVAVQRKSGNSHLTRCRRTSQT